MDTLKPGDDEKQESECDTGIDVTDTTNDFSECTESQMEVESSLFLENAPYMEDQEMSNISEARTSQIDSGHVVSIDELSQSVGSARNTAEPLVPPAVQDTPNESQSKVEPELAIRTKKSVEIERVSGDISAIHAMESSEHTKITVDSPTCLPAPFKGSYGSSAASAGPKGPLPEATPGQDSSLNADMQPVAVAGHSAEETVSATCSSSTAASKAGESSAASLAPSSMLAVEETAKQTPADVQTVVEAESSLHSTGRQGDADTEMSVDVKQIDGTGTVDPQSNESLGAEVRSNAPEDIAGDLENILSSSLKFEGAFSFMRTYPVAPNPSLQLETLGTIGLPLSTREARAVIEASVQAPFGMGERTVVDKDVRDTWEMDASKVHFGNPMWRNFMDGVVREVCAALGVNFDASKPRCDLYKLLVYETGSHFLPHVDTEKQDGMFATIIVVLPSQFTGGIASLSHGALSTAYDTSAISLSETSVLAWYTDVTHSITPITSGYRLALAYNLLHTTNTLRPALASDADTVTKLRQLLTSWRRHLDDDDVPEKIVYLLSHKYSQANLSGRALKGADANTMAILNVLADELGFHLGLANVVCHVSGPAVDDGYHGRGRGGWDSDSEGMDDDDDDDVEMEEVAERSCTVENLVALDGALIRKTLDVDENETIPADLADSMDDGDYDDQEYEGYMGNGAGSVDRFYRRSALVIWPQESHFSIVYGENGCTTALDALRNTISKSPTEHERQLIDFVFTSPSMPPPRALQSVCHAACLWVDINLWNRAMDSFNGTASFAPLGRAELLSAITTFGLEAVRPTLEVILKTEPRNEARWNFLQALAAWANSQAPLDLRAGLCDWISEQKMQVAHTLQALSEKDLSTVVEMTKELGGPTFLNKIILPQLKMSALAPFLKLLSDHLIQTRDSLVQSPDDQLLLRQTITELLSTAISKTDFFAIVARPPRPGYGWHPPELLPSPALAHSFLETCLAFGSEDLVSLVLTKLATMTGQTAESAQRRATHVLLPLLPLLEKSLQSHPSASPVLGLSTFMKTTVRLYLDAMYANRKGLSNSDMPLLLQAVRRGGGIALLNQTIIPKLKTLPWNEAGWRTLVDELQAKRNEAFLQSDSGVQIGTVITDAVQAYVKQVSLSYTTAHPGAGSTSVAKIIDILNVCFETGNPQCGSALLARALDAKLVTALYITNVLVPLITELRKFTVKRRIPPTSEPFRLVFCSIMRHWKANILGAKPPDPPAYQDSIARWTCTCGPCMEIRKFLTVGDGRQHALNRIGAPKRKHVEGELGRHAVGAATWQGVRSVPQGLTVTKSDAVYKAAKWKGEQTKGLAMVKIISSSEEELRLIFGDLYAPLMSLLRGRAVPAAVAPLAARAAQWTGLPAASTSAAAPVAGAYPFGTGYPGSVGAVQGGAAQAAMPVASASSGPPAGGGLAGAAGAPVATTTPKNKKRKHYDHIDVIDLCTP